MKTKIAVLLTTVLLAASSNTEAQKTFRDIEGSWVGRLSEAGVSLRIVLNFAVINADSVKFTLDSPDQGAEGLPGGKVSVIGDTVIAKVPMIVGQYKGLIVNDTLLKGSWSQAGRSFTLDMTRMHEKISYNRPQEPKPPFPYKTEEVIFRNEKEGFDLSGTLTLPEGTGPFTAVILISGSGPQDRDESLMYHKPFLVLSDYLTRKAIAVLRYDDRGTGKSKGNLTTATSLDLADDVQAAVSFLYNRPEINKKSIGLAGHSEGALIAPIVASNDTRIAFIVSLAGPGISGDRLISRQTHDLMKAQDTEESEIEVNVRRLNKLFEIVLAESDQKKAASQALAWYNGELDKMNITPEERKAMMSEFAQSLVSMNNPWFRYFISTDPAVFWSKVKCPVLALNGEKDLQVNYEENLPAIDRALKNGGNKKVKTKSLPELNHLFQHCKTCSPAEYVSIEETFSPEVLEIIGDWITNTVKK